MFTSLAFIQCYDWVFLSDGCALVNHFYAPLKEFEYSQDPFLTANSTSYIFTHRNYGILILESYLVGCKEHSAPLQIICVT